MNTSIMALGFSVCIVFALIGVSVIIDNTLGRAPSFDTSPRVDNNYVDYLYEDQDEIKTTNADMMEHRKEAPGFGLNWMDALTDLPKRIPQIIPRIIASLSDKPTSDKGQQDRLTSKASRHRRDVSTIDWAAKKDNQTVMSELVDDASKHLRSQNHTKFETRVLESGFVAPNLGFVMEQVGSYMEYSGYVYVPIIYHMPHLIETSLKGSGEDCNITINPQHQALIINLLKEKIGTLIPDSYRTRSKRFIETILLGGAVAWNRASIWSLQDNVRALESQLNTMKEKNQIVVSSINTLIDNTHAIHHSVNRQARILREFIEKSKCSDLISNYFREVYATWLSLAPNDFARVVDSALSGKITSDLLPAADVMTTLLKHPAMIGTAYSRDMTLLYELGKLSLHQVNYDPYPMVSGVMIFPRILMDRSAAMMRTYSTHIKTTNGYRKLNLPHAMACRSTENCWEISPYLCKEMLTLTLCPKQNRPNFNMCLKNIMTDIRPSQACEWKLSLTPATEVLQFGGGVLISSTSDKGEVMINQGRELIVHKELEPSDTPRVLTSSDGDYLHMGGQIYQLTQESMKTGYEINLNLTAPIQRESLEGMAVEGWIPESKIPMLREKPWAPPANYTWWTLVGTMSLVVIIVCVLIKYSVNIRRIHARVKAEISGWMTVPTAPPSYPTGRTYPGVQTEFVA